ncbi:DUF885 domain-containing protein [Luteithermobacter gelatinilyticus]|uniref:DUF885 domain-containing protein n=1 Tax=Luteithermobacter gelatinilyticus TaxID=2582913 RepID=UPI0011064C75|nr:DUF885 family protein [Luteithermobacter gelatinilyticus]
MRASSLLALILTLFCTILPGQLSAQPNKGKSSAPEEAITWAEARLRALYEAEWAWRMVQEARELDEEGNYVASDHLPKVDAATQQKRLEYWTAVLNELDAIPHNELSDAEKVNAQIFRTILEGFVTDIRYKTYEAPFNSDSFFWTALTPRGGFRTVQEYQNYIGRLKDIPRYFDEQIANMRAGLARGFTVPRVAVTGRDKTIEPYLRADDGNPLFEPFTKMPPTIPASQRTALQAAARDAIRDHAVGAYSRLLTMLRNEYLPQARMTVGASALPDGAAYYRAMIEKFTTLKMEPEEIHQIGLKEVARIKSEMQATMKKTGFEGTLSEFMVYLRNDPQFYAKTPEELLGRAAYIVKQADGKLKDVIGFLPRFRHGLIPVPKDLAPIYTGGRGGLENCMFNTYNLPARPLYTLPALVLHECTPGHSFQAALALEAPERPEFRKEVYFSGYGEGWGLYTEWLGTLMGIYQTPYEEFGRLTYEMWRAVRLVVDTGLHHYGWSREQALTYMKDNLAMSEHEITTEVDRYISWPGQALAYKLGELQIRRHRREAEAALGAKFDQRKFHDAILALGAVPLPVLEARMKEFIADGGETPDKVYCRER